MTPRDIFQGQQERAGTHMCAVDTRSCFEEMSSCISNLLTGMSSIKSNPLVAVASRALALASRAISAGENPVPAVLVSWRVSNTSVLEVMESRLVLCFVVVWLRDTTVALAVVNQCETEMRLREDSAPESETSSTLHRAESSRSVPQASTWLVRSRVRCKTPISSAHYDS